MDSELFELWKNYRSVPNWLKICRLLGVGEEGISELEEFDDAMIPLLGYRDQETGGLKWLKNNTDREWANGRRVEYCRNQFDWYESRLKELLGQYEVSQKNGEPYWIRSLYRLYILDVQRWVEKFQKEIRYRTMKEKQHQPIEDRIPIAKQRQFSEFIEVEKGKALCPFHNEKTPSFWVKNGRGYCFGCGWSGDIIDFVQARENMTLPEAVRYLAGE